MFDVAPTELLLVAVVALVVIGPKDLPRVMRVVGNWVGKARGMARHFRSGLDEMMRQAELEEMEAKWKAHNEAIMRDYPDNPSTAAAADAMVPDDPPPPAQTPQPALNGVAPSGASGQSGAGQSGSGAAAGADAGAMPPPLAPDGPAAPARSPARAGPDTPADTAGPAAS